MRPEFASGTSDTATITPPGDATQPHAVTDITGTTTSCNAAGDNYCYDLNGNLTGRPGTANTTQTITWDPEHRMASASDSSGATSFVYDPDGARLIRKTPTDTTLYIEGHELTLTGGTLTSKRYYTLAGVTVAIRDSATAQVTYLLGDQLGSSSVAVNASTGAASTQRYLPYGATRGPGVSLPTDRGWIGQVKDGATGMQYLNARYYDPTIGRFTSTDPMANLDSMATLDPYGYSGGSPVASKDRTGLLCEGDNPCGRGTSSNNGNCIATCAGTGLRVPPVPVIEYVGPEFIGPLTPGQTRDPSQWCAIGRPLGFQGPCGMPPLRGEYSENGARAVVDYLVAIGGGLSDALEGAAEELTVGVVAYRRGSSVVVARNRFHPGRGGSIKNLVSADDLVIGTKWAGRVFVGLEAGLTAWDSWQESEGEQTWWRVSRATAEATGEAGGGLLGGSLGSIGAGLFCAATGGATCVVGALVIVGGSAFIGSKAGEEFVETIWEIQ